MNRLFNQYVSSNWPKMRSIKLTGPFWLVKVGEIDRCNMEMQAFYDEGGDEELYIRLCLGLRKNTICVQIYRLICGINSGERLGKSYIEINIKDGAVLQGQYFNEVELRVVNEALKLYEREYNSCYIRPLRDCNW